MQVQQQTQANQKRVAGFDQQLPLEAERQGSQQKQRPTCHAGQPMAEQSRAQQRHEQAGRNPKEMLHQQGQVHAPVAAELVKEGEEHRVKQRAEGVKLVQVLARQQHSRHGVVILLVQRRHPERRGIRVFDVEADPNDQPQENECDQRPVKTTGRKILAEERSTTRSDASPALAAGQNFVGSRR